MTTLIHLSGRQRNILEIVRAQKLDGLLLNSVSNVSYAAGFQAPESYLFICPGGFTLITDFRYTADFKQKAPPAVKVKQYRSSIFKTIIQTMRSADVRRVGIEARHLTFAECRVLKELAGRGIQFMPLEETIESLRAVKDAAEIGVMKKAIEITQAAYSFIGKRLKPGKRETGIAADLEHFIRLKGAQKSAFDIIVASGPNGAYPHAVVSERVMVEGDAVVVDMGVQYNGYCCDLTRTFFLGRITPFARRIAGIVRQAQQLAIDSIRPGARIKDVDGMARGFIVRQGFGKNFGHALGHGVGLDVHESPSINRKNAGVLKEGMVVTIEPGIYIPGEFGVRMEEMVLVTNTGREVLSGNNSH